MQASDFDYILPPELIAQQPLAQRSASRLLSIQNNHFLDKSFTDIVDFLEPDDLLVFNNTKVIPGRLLGHKKTGGSVEFLLEKILDDNKVLAQLKANKRLLINTVLIFPHQLEMRIIDKVDNFFILQVLSAINLQDYLIQYGHIPLPPYIKREDNTEDQIRYQTVFAENLGAVAAPTASLHFDQALLDKITAKGVKQAFITLHVGAGTFQPLRCENIYDHIMHSERFSIEKSACDLILETKAKHKRVIAVGTTVVRVLETVAQKSAILQPMQSETRLFIYPGFDFKITDAIITNFHLPKSTLLMLVSAFLSKAIILQAYQHAIEKKYRFFSYGDAMFIQK